MSTFERFAPYVLFAAGAIAIVVGLGIVVLAHTLTRSRVASSNDLLRDNLQTAERAADVLVEHDDELTNIARLPAEATDAARQLPPTLRATTEVLGATRQVLLHTADTLDAIQGFYDLFTPGSPLEKTSSALDGLASEIDKLRKHVAQTRDPVESMIDQTVAAIGAIETLRAALAEAGLGPKLLEQRLERSLALQERANLPAAAAWQQTAFGGGYMLIGLLLVGVGGVWRRLARPDQSFSLPRSET